MAEGLEHTRRARWKHGARSREVRELLRINRHRWRNLVAILKTSDPVMQFIAAGRRDASGQGHQRSLERAPPLATHWQCCQPLHG
jgi:hypothetical protein